MVAPRLHPLPSLAVLRLDGADAAGFLQGQITQDVGRLSDSTSVEGAYCTAQGRVLALPRLVAVDDAILAVLPADIAHATAERLRRFVLRAKVRIAPAEDLTVLACVAGDDCGLRAAVPACPARAGDVTHDGRVTIIRLRGHRVLVIAAPGDTATATPGELASWEQAGIAQGEPSVVTATAERWVPQMLNLDLVEAVSFSKGCYPGQEIVARTQHLGRIKRRMLRYGGTAGAALSPGDELFADETRAAEVVRVACLDDRTELLAVVSLDHTGQPLLADDGRAFTALPLPYAIPELETR